MAPSIARASHTGCFLHVPQEPHQPVAQEKATADLLMRGSDAIVADENDYLVHERKRLRTAHAHDHQRSSPDVLAAAQTELLVLPADWSTLSIPVVECPRCKGLYMTKANGELRKHRCTIPLSALPVSLLLPSRGREAEGGRPLQSAPESGGSASSPPGV